MARVSLDYLDPATHRGVVHSIFTEPDNEYKFRGYNLTSGPGRLDGLLSGDVLSQCLIVSSGQAVGFAQCIGANFRHERNSS